MIGWTDPTGAKKEPDDPIEVADLFATLLTCFGIDADGKNVTPIGCPIAFSKGNPIVRLLT